MKGCRPQSQFLPSSAIFRDSLHLSEPQSPHLSPEIKRTPDSGKHATYVLIPGLWSRYCHCYTHFADEETEAQKDPVTHAVRGRADVSQAAGLSIPLSTLTPGSPGFHQLLSPQPASPVNASLLEILPRAQLWHRHQTHHFLPSSGPLESH